MIRIRSLALALSLASLPVAAFAQKHALTEKDFDSWKSINGQAISHDGHYLAYGVFPQEGDGEVIVRDLKTGQEWHQGAGQLPPPPLPDPNSETPPAPRSVKLIFSNDSKTLMFLPFATREAVEKGKKDKKSPAHEELVVLELASGKAARLADVKSFQTPEKADGFLVYQKYGVAPAAAPEAAAANEDADSEEDQARGGGRAGAGGTEQEVGSTLVLRKLVDGSEHEFADVLEYQVGKEGKLIAYSVAAKKSESDGVFTLDPATGATHPLVQGMGRFEHLAFDEKDNELAFIGDPSSATEEKSKSPYVLYLWKTGEAGAEQIVAATSTDFRKGFVVSDHATLLFSKDGSRLFFGAAPPPPPAHPKEIDEDKVNFDLWSYKDDHIVPMQKARATADRNRSFRAVYLVKQKKLIQLADDSMPELTANEQARYAIGTYDKEYRPMQEYDTAHVADYFLVDLETGERTPLTKKSSAAMRWSGAGMYALSFDGKDWSATSLPGGKTINLTAKLPVKFWNEEDDMPETLPAYGVAGWTKDDKYVLLYDHYDLWQVAPDGSSAVNLTQGLGRKGHVEFRYVKLDPEEKTIDPAKPILLRAENQETRESGYYTTAIDAKAEPKKLLMVAKDVGSPAKAKDADVYVTTEQTFTEFPDLLVTDATFSNLKKVSDVNPQKAGLLWGTDELVSFENIDGVKLQGVLYKPEGFDPAKKYPMIVNLYEKMSQNVNHFDVPRPMNSINISYYVSNGYLVFTPDIVYQTGYPGQSALKCVMAGVNAVAAKGFVDEKNIGVQGHSWGGYQIAYMVTQTNRFKAAESGAPVVNMIAAYDGIRWGPGIPRQFQYEHTQSRIGGTPWQYPLRFIENSPIFMVDKIQTPMLLLQNDADDAVPWYQGIEFFLSLRRLGKEAYMFSYNGEPHNLRRRPDQKDFAARMAQFFDYELKGAPKPKWMSDGIPYLHTPEQVSLDQ